jgi:hypothetical protein
MAARPERDSDGAGRPNKTHEFGVKSWHRYATFAGKARSSATTSLTRTTSQAVKALVNGAPKRIRVCTSCIKNGKIAKA